MQKPAALKPGDKIAVVVPSGPVEDDRLKAGVAALKGAGFAVELAENILARKGYLAGEAEARARTLQGFFEREDIAAILSARGGFGSVQMLPYLEAAAIRRHPKIFVGYSDVSILLNWLVQRCRIAAFHGPMVAMELARGLAGRNADFFWGTLLGKMPEWRVELGESIRPGAAEGEMAGGCLSTIITTVGTPYEIDTAGKILLLEDVGEKPYRIERMLTHLKMAGKTAGLAGLVFGSFTHCEGEGERDVRAIVRELFHDAPYPVATGLPAGHGEDNLIMPLGVKMRLDATARRLSLIEPPVDTAGPRLKR
ncbi:MAG TPA: LD-carboxypeptidase [Candidatus Binatia bacterium]